LVPTMIHAQVAGVLVGVCFTHIMFDVPILQLSTHAQTAYALWSAAVIATVGLLGTILRCDAYGVPLTAGAVAAYITGADWFTASTSFANPAVTIARAFTDPFAGIRLADAPGFIAAQCVGLMIVLAVAKVMGFRLP